MPTENDSKVKILIVDDEPGICKSLQIFMEQNGFAVRIAETVAEAVSVLACETIDAIVCDIVLPGPSGMELLQHVHDISPDIPVVMISGEPTIQTTVRAMRLGAFDYLAKPVRPKMLLEILGEAVERRKKRQLTDRQVGEIGAQYRRLMDNLQDMIWHTDLNGVVEYVNHAVESMLGYSPEEAIGNTPETYWTKESAEKAQQWIREALKADPRHTSFRGQVDYVHKKGYIVPCEINVTIIYNSSGRIVALEGVSRIRD